MLNQSSKLRKWSLFVTTLATAAFLLQGCNGGDDGAAGPAGAAGATGATGQPGKDATAVVNVASLTPAQWAELAPQGQVTNVVIGSPPVVQFKVTDANGKPIVGLGNARKRSTDLVATNLNVVFTLAKLVPGTNGAPSKWVNYIVTTTPTVASPAAAPTRPSTDSNGTLVDNGDGSYQYTFYRDITKVKADVAAMTVSAPNNKADLGDLTYDPTLTHRLVVEIYGNAFGTGTNTADGSDSGVPAVAMKNPLNIFYDFIPATGKVVTASDTQREIVSKAACNECHTKVGVTTPHGGRVDPRFCVTCHTDQRGYGRTEAATTGTGYSGSTYVINGFTVGTVPNYIHKIHMGEELTKTGYNYGGVLFNEITYPQPITNCVKCHDGSATAVNKTAQGDNWKNAPNRLACGSCHDGISFATGQGTTLDGQTYGHIGGAKADDSLCVVCHSATDIKGYHVTVDPTGANGRGGYPLNTATDVPTPGYPSGQGPSIPLASQLNLPAGVYKIGLEIKQVTLTGAAGAKKAKVVYRILKDDQPVTLNPTGYLINNVDGTPDIYVAYGLPQDGITAPVDWTTTVSAHVIDIRDGKSGNSQTGPDASGYYTATLGATIPDAATMVTAALGVNYNGFVQLNLPAYAKGIRLREPKFAIKTADGVTARRAIVSADKCNSCHGQLGVSPSFHSGARNNGEGCAMCHTPNNSTGHTGAANNYGGGWSVSAKNLIHGIHASAKREQAFTYEATAANPNGFKSVTYPAILNNCEQCHVAGSYDFSASANKAAVPNLLWTTEAKTDMSNPGNVPSIGLSPWITTLGRGQVNYTTDNLVSSPISSSCFGCHDSSPALAHMQSNGGSLYASASTVAVGGDRSNGFSKVEACLVCHSSGKVADIKAVHLNF